MTTLEYYRGLDIFADTYPNSLTMWRFFSGEIHKPVSRTALLYFELISCEVLLLSGSPVTSNLCIAIFGAYFATLLQFLLVVQTILSKNFACSVMS